MLVKITILSSIFSKFQQQHGIVQNQISFLSASAAPQIVLINLNPLSRCTSGMTLHANFLNFIYGEWQERGFLAFWWLFLLSDDGYWICHFADWYDPVWKYGEVALLFDYRMNFERKWLDLAQRERMRHHKSVCRDVIWFPIRLQIHPQRIYDSTWVPTPCHNCILVAVCNSLGNFNAGFRPSYLRLGPIHYWNTRKAPHVLLKLV